MNSYSRRLDRLEPKPDHNERIEEAGRRIHEWLFQEREMILKRDPPTKADQSHLDEMGRYTDDFRREPEPK